MISFRLKGNRIGSFFAFYIVKDGLWFHKNGSLFKLRPFLKIDRLYGFILSYSFRIQILVVRILGNKQNDKRCVARSFISRLSAAT